MKTTVQFPRDLIVQRIMVSELEHAQSNPAATISISSGLTVRKSMRIIRSEEALRPTRLKMIMPKEESEIGDYIAERMRESRRPVTASVTA
jgi:hypothetical protein